ncbi:MAG: GyrI-like domain-containing protein [Bacillota bacterium]
MDYKTIHFTRKTYAGYKVDVDLNAMNATNFIALWDRLFNDTDKTLMKEDDAFIGFESYLGFGKMQYFALAPKHAIKTLKKDHHVVELPKGDYLLFKNTIVTHGPAFFKTVYTFIKDNHIDIDRTFDIEYIPRTFNRDDGKSPIYVGVKLINNNDRM